MRLDKFLANAGLGSRKEVKKFIKDGNVSVNGKVVAKATVDIDENMDEVKFNNQKLIYEKYLYIMMNKPQGFISATRSVYDDTVLDLLDEELQDRELSPAGRLDKDTEGLIFLTNDGRLIHNIISPNKKIVKKYYARVDAVLSNGDIEAFERGIYLEKEAYMTLPAKLEIISDYECYVYIHEGKYHQVKRMLAICGKNVTYLKRLAIGPLQLDPELGLGSYRRLREDELLKLREVVDIEKD